MYDSWFLMASYRQTYKLEAHKAMLLLQAQGLKHCKGLAVVWCVRLYHAVDLVQTSGFAHFWLCDSGFVCLPQSVMLSTNIPEDINSKISKNLGIPRTKLWQRDIAPWAGGIPKASPASSTELLTGKTKGIQTSEGLWTSTAWWKAHRLCTPKWWFWCWMWQSTKYVRTTTEKQAAFWWRTNILGSSEKILPWRCRGSKSNHLNNIQQCETHLHIRTWIIKYPVHVPI